MPVLSGTAIDTVILAILVWLARNVSDDHQRQLNRPVDRPRGRRPSDSVRNAIGRQRHHDGPPLVRLAVVSSLRVSPGRPVTLLPCQWIWASFIVRAAYGLRTS
jgi:hypothetical protein